MTISQQKRFNKTYLNTPRKARTMGSRAGNQRFNIKNWTHSKFAVSLNLALGKPGEYAWDFYKLPKGLFTWSGGPRSSGVGFFCFHALEDTKQKKPTSLDRGSPLHVNRV